MRQRLFVNTFVLPSSSVLLAQPIDAHRTQVLTTKSLIRCVASPHETSASTRWNSSVPSPTARRFSCSTRKSNCSTTDGVTMNGALLVAGGSCLKSYITTVRTITDAATDIITVIIRPRTRSRALRRMDLQHAHWAAGCDQRLTAARRWWTSSHNPSSKP